MHEVTEIFDELTLANNMSGGQYDNRVEEFDDDISQWKKQLQAVRIFHNFFGNYEINFIFFIPFSNGQGYFASEL